MNNDKREELRIILQQQEVDILGLTESWGNETIVDAERSFPG